MSVKSSNRSALIEYFEEGRTIQHWEQNQAELRENRRNQAQQRLDQVIKGII